MASTHALAQATIKVFAFYWQGVHNSTTDPRTLGGGHGSSNATNGAEGSNAYLVCRLARTRKTQACLHAAATRASATRSTSSSSGRGAGGRPCVRGFSLCICTNRVHVSVHSEKKIRESF